MFKTVQSLLKCTNCSSVEGAMQKLAIRCCSSQSHIVQMRGLDYETKEQDVIDFFKPLGLTPKNVHLKCDGAGRVAGVSEVEFSTHAEAVVAMRKRNAFMGNRFIRLALKSSEIENEVTKKADSIDPKKSSFSQVGLNILGNIDKTSLPAGHFVRMKNVPKRMTDQAIYDFFWPIGVHAISVRPMYNESGLRIGEFDVQFMTHEDAFKAMAKNNAYLGKKFVELSILPS